ncbi:MAG TPA: PHB depolymerase family esterase [Candidatus Eisenbacteria bacterium]
MPEIAGARSFDVRAPWKLVLPEGAAPAGGWPLVACLHGWGQSADYFARLCRPLLFDDAAFLFPQGPWSFEMRKEGKIRIGHAWYLYDGGDEPFRSTLGRAEEHLLGVIDDVASAHPIDRARVALFGFSQGAYTGYFITLRNTDRFVAMAAMGGGRLKPEFVEDELVGAPRIPYLLLHGLDDVSVPLERTSLMKGELERWGFPVELKEFPAAHEMTSDMLDAVREYFRHTLASVSDST